MVELLVRLRARTIAPLAPSMMSGALKTRPPLPLIVPPDQRFVRVLTVSVPLPFSVPPVIWNPSVDAAPLRVSVPPVTEICDTPPVRVVVPLTVVEPPLTCTSGALPLIEPMVIGEPLKFAVELVMMALLKLAAAWSENVPAVVLKGPAPVIGTDQLVTETAFFLIVP